MSTLTRTRGFRFERAKADGSGPKTFTFKASDGEFDRDNDRISAKGWDLKAFNANPVILVNHDAWNLPIGKGKAYVEGDALMVDVTFDQTDELAKRVESKVEQGIMSAVSVRFSAEREHAKANDKGGLDFEKQELLEVSLVTIPANPRATRAKGLDDLVDALVERVKQFTPAATSRAATTEAKMTEEEIKALKAKAEELEKLKAAQAKREAEEAEAKRTAEVEAAVQKAIEAERAKIRAELQNEVIDGAKGNREAPASRTVVTDVREAAKGSGLHVARFVLAQFHAKTYGTSFQDALKARGYNDMAKALSADSFSGLGSFVREEWASDFIELLRNEAVVRKAGPRTLPLKGTLRFGGQATGATASYGGETSEIAKSNPTTSAPVELSEKKLTALVVVPNDLARLAGLNVEQFIRDDLIRVMALKEDEKFLYGSGSSYEPEGLQSRLASAHKYAMTALATAKKPTIGELKIELNKAKKKLKAANAPMRSMAWFMSPVTESGILNAVGPGGEGYNVFEREMVERGTLAGFPYFVTNQIPDNGTSCDMFLFDMSEVLLGESMGLEIEVFPNGHWSESGTAKSGISTDQSVIRAISKHDIALRHDVSGINVTGVTWGQP